MSDEQWGRVLTLLVELGGLDFAVFGAINDEQADIVERLIEIAVNSTVLK